MRALPASEPFTTAEAFRCGWTESALRNAVAQGRLIRVRRGVYAAAGTTVAALNVAAAALAYPGLPLSHLSSAACHDIPVIGRRPKLPEMTVEPRGGGRIRGVYAYRATLRDHEICAVGGRLVTSPARTAIDIARHYPTVTAVAALDHVLHAGLATVDELRDVLDFCRGWPGAPRARQAVRLADSRTESPLETVSRLVIPRLGLPAPEPQVNLYDELGRFVGRGDFYWDECGVVGEADGRAKYGADDDGSVLTRQHDREEDLDDTGLEVTRWGWRRAWSETDQLRYRIDCALTRGAARSAAGLPRRWTAVSTPRILVL